MDRTDGRNLSPARSVLDSYLEQMGYHRSVRGDQLHEAATDLVADLLLVLDSRGVDVDGSKGILDSARLHFECERIDAEGYAVDGAA